MAAITSTAPVAAQAGAGGAAIALRASLESVSALTPGEKHLLTELLDRIAAAG